jgi:hypothetical protein
LVLPTYSKFHIKSIRLDKFNLDRFLALQDLNLNLYLVR